MVEAIGKFWEEVAAQADGLAMDVLVSLDEEFHLRLAGLGGNTERVRLLEHINARIFFVRKVNLENETRRRNGFVEHRQMVNLLLADESETAEKLLRRHLMLNADQAMDAICKGLASIYGESVA